MNRIESIDVFRLLAITAVISIHTEPFGKPPIAITDQWMAPGILINQFCRFAVPFFFVISGFLWGRKLQGAGSPSELSTRMAKRLLVTFVSWSLIYLLPYNLVSFFTDGIIETIKISYWHAISLLRHPVQITFGGTKSHLWFLVSLLFSLGIATFFVNRKLTISLALFALILYIFALLAKPYANTPIGIQIDFNTRFGPFFGTIFFVSGYLLSSRKPTHEWLIKGLLVFLTGFCLHYYEWHWLRLNYGIDANQDFLIGTYFMGLGAAIAALSDHPFLKVRKLSYLGRLTLGIYAIHFIFVDILRPIGTLTNSTFWEVGYILLVLFLSIASTIAFSKFNIYKRLAT